ncbi:MAG: pantothenate kinase [Candidatus Bathyarchaeota archaeon]|nr:pantothenate kinase [Candidatus Bathyarchaeota archaeon]
MKLYLGVDIGSSITKAVALEGKNIVGFTSIATTDPIAAASGAIGKLLAEHGYELEDILRIAVTGGGARFLKVRELFGIPLTMVDEVEAIGLGGIALTGKRRALVVSMGTGTAMVVVEGYGGSIKHIGGTGVGGGTLLGLGRLLLNKHSVEALENLAEKGDPRRVDITVADIAGGPVGIVPGEATASNFGKVSDEARDEDIAAAIFNLVGQVVGVLAVFASKIYGMERDIVAVGKLTSSKLIVKAMKDVASIFDAEICFPNNGGYCTALGAAYKLAKELSL